MAKEINDTQPYRQTLLRAVGMSKRFGALTAVNCVDFDVPRHGIVSLIGPNGAGKTVFFNMLTGIVKPDSGDVWFNGQRINGQRPDSITRLGIARTFQGIRLFKKMTVLDNVLVGQHIHMSRNLLEVVLRSTRVQDEEEVARKRSFELLDFVGLRAQALTNAGDLPYGAGRNLEIARALATSPQLLLLDEPTAGMNPSETAAMVELISRLRRDLGLAILLIEHDMKVVMRISDRVSVMDYGTKIAEGSPDQVRRNALVIEAYLGRSVGAERELNPPEAQPELEPTPGLQIQPKPVTG
jgi:ABC-type branched-chain amino acid transport systems, ATPase component